MNNLGTREQGKKVYQALIRKLDNTPALREVTYKDVDFLNLRKYMMQVSDANRVISKTLGIKKISFMLRNVPPANVTNDYREVTIYRKKTEL
jgi:hypothetical protein